MRIVLLALFLSFNAHAMSHKHSVPTPTPTATPVPSITTSPTPYPIGTKIISLKCDSSCTAAEAAEVPQIETKMNAVLTSDCFLKYFNGLKRIDMSQGFTGAQIVAMMRKPTSLTLNYYNYSNTQVDGYEESDDYSTIHFNRTAMKANGFNVCDKASLGGHELSHVHGFFHNGNSADKNWQTVPYQVNHAFDTEDDFGVVQPSFGACCK